MLINLICKRCGATESLEEMDGQEYVVCASCNSKIMIFGNHTKTTTINHYKDENVTRIKESEIIKDIKEMELSADAKKRKQFINLGLGATAVLVVSILIIFSVIADRNASGPAEERNLQRIHNEILLNIANADFASALTQAYTLISVAQFDADRYRWDEIRNSLLVQINAGLEEQNLERLRIEILASIADGDYTTALIQANRLHVSVQSYADRLRWDEIRDNLVADIEAARDLAARGESFPTNFLIEFLDTSTSAVEILINGNTLGIQNPGTIRAFYAYLHRGTNILSFRVGSLEVDRAFETLETLDYFTFTLDEQSRFLRSNVLVVTFDGLTTPAEVRQILLD